MMRNKKLITFLVFWILYLVNLLQCYLCNWTFDFPPSHHWKCSTNIITGRCISHINVNLFQTHTCTTYLYALIKLFKYPFIRHSLNLALLKENTATYLPSQLESDRFIFCALYIPVLCESSFRPWHELNIYLNQNTKT